VFAAGLLCAQSRPDFPRDIYQVLQKADCKGCHNREGVASTTRLQFPEDAPSVEEVEAFGESLRRFVDSANPENSLLLNKPTNRIPHAGGRRIAPDSQEEAALRVWIQYLATSKPPETKAPIHRAAASKPPVLRRLTHSQYDNTVRDLLGDATRPSRNFPPEDFIDGYKNQYEGQSISPILAEAYGEAAEKLAAAAKLPTYKDFVSEFGRRAFRRPLTAEEKTRYGELKAKAGDRAVAEAMLQSPAFLYRSEIAEQPSLRGWVRASRLSYLLWDTMPDDALFAAAAKGELDTRAGFEKAARRMLEDPRARQALDEFISQWMRFDRVITMVKDRRSYPVFTREVAVAMTEETRRLFADLVWNDRNFMEFFTAGDTFINGELAGIYGIPAPSDDYSRVKLPEGSGRAGILGQATFLALTSKPSESAPTSRGLFIREQFLCQNVPQPPPGVNTSLPPQTEGKPMNNREQLGAHTTNPACASCHSLIDPIGFGLEKFDGVGAYREKQKVTIPSFNRREQSKTVEVPIDSKGFIAGIQNSGFETPRQLGEVLARTAQCQECVVKQYLRYARGRHERAADHELISKIADDFRRSQFRFKELMISLVAWTEFPPGS
jgi:hypothetical protein